MLLTCALYTYFVNKKKKAALSSYPLIEVFLTFPKIQYNEQQVVSHKFQLVLRNSRIDEHHVDIRLIRTPRCYGQYSLSLGKVHALSLNRACLIRTTGIFLSLAQSNFR